MKKITSQNRRQAIKKMGAAAIAAPFMNIVAGGSMARAACQSNTARRVIFYYHPTGVDENWWIDDFTDSLRFGSSLAPLQPYADKLVYFRNLAIEHGLDGDHRNGTIASLVGNSQRSNRSIDVELNEWLRQQGTNEPLLLNYLGFAMPSIINEEHFISYVNPGQPNVGLLTNPQEAWDHIFGPLVEDNIPAEKRSLIDRNKAELDALRSQLGNIEKSKLDKHLASLRQLENRLGAKPSCTDMLRPDISNYTQRDVGVLQEASDLTLDIAFEAMKCGLSRVTTISHGAGQSDMNSKITGTAMATHPAPPSSYMAEAHSLSEQYSLVKTWEAQQLAKLVSKLANTEEPDSTCAGSMLDNSIIYVVSPFGLSAPHDARDARHLMIGGAGGAWETGRVVDANHTPHSRNLVSIAHAMGHTSIAPDFGGWGSGPMPGL
jgi:hypothetical protein